MSVRRPTLGVFDSGFGGLTVLKALLEHIPGADYAYFGDTARLPYGSKSAETVAKYAAGAAHFLEQHGAQLLVIACNTASALALPQITRACSLPVIGVIEPSAESAARASKSRRAVVIGTEATISSHAYHQALESRGIKANEKACPLLVPLVEEGWIDHPVTEQVAQIYLREGFSDEFRSSDVLLLGCTHYPLLRALFRRIVPPNVTVVDSAESTAKVILDLLLNSPPETKPGDERRHPPRFQFFVTDSTEKFRRLGERFLGHSIDDVQHVELKE
jgi:glutamate racemase